MVTEPVSHTVRRLYSANRFRNEVRLSPSVTLYIQHRFLSDSAFPYINIIFLKLLSSTRPLPPSANKGTMLYLSSPLRVFVIEGNRIGWVKTTIRCGLLLKIFIVHFRFLLIISPCASAVACYGPSILCLLYLLHHDLSLCFALVSCAGILKQSIGARNRVEIGLSYRPARARIF
jgi:hypothetical protein